MQSDNKNIQLTKCFLLPQKFRYAGYILLAAGIFLAYLRFYAGIKLPMFDIRVFAVFSSYFQTKYFSIIENNFSEEAAGLLILAGLLFIAFSRDKNEDENALHIRLHAFVLAVYMNCAFLIFSFLFIFGLGFIYAMTLNIFSFFIFYIVLLRLYTFRNKQKSNSTLKPANDGSF